MSSDNSGSNLVRIHSDAPAARTARFGFGGYADTLAGLIANPSNQTPLVIGIYGSWGSGKTTLMQAMRQRLDGQATAELAQRLGAPPGAMRPCKTVWFQAWKYDKEDQILAGLLEAIFQAMARDGFFSRAKAEIEKLAKSLNKKKIVDLVSQLVMGVDVSDFFKELEYKKQLGFYDSFRSFFDGLICVYLNWRARLKPAAEFDDSCGALVIFIDDLDRCPQPRIVKVLETVKLFLDHKGCVFVIGADREIITKALAESYKEDAHRFMEKIVQVTFSLPKVTGEMFQPFLDDLGEEQAAIGEYLDLILPAMGFNPRQLKRFINNLNLRHGLMRSRNLAIDFEPVLHWGIIEHAFPQAAADMEDNPRNLFSLKKHLDEVAAGLGHRRVWEADEQKLLEMKVPQGLHKYLRHEAMVKIFDSFETGEASFNELLTFSASVESEEPGTEQAAASAGRALPEGMKLSGKAKAPGEPGRAAPRGQIMVEIPAGPFKFGEKPEEAFIDKPFWIDIYPVTNASYRVFVESGGYENEKWWPQEGWKWRKENRILRPDYWDDPQWNRDGHPVVGISWYEAMAYCNWLSHTSKEGFTYDLPSERQWERAARGTDGRVYPWGDEFDQERCNTRESGIDGTTRVDRYADGVSPEGCYDMAGNVWEWTSDFYDEDKDSYTLKGGSWSDEAQYARCAARNGGGPGARFNFIGFRCARTLL
jgi:iron(II)-dependent oxidoreductase